MNVNAFSSISAWHSMLLSTR